MSALQTEHKPACSQPHLEYCNTFFFFFKKQVLKLWCFQIKTPIELCSHTPPRALQQLPCSIISFCTGTEPDQVPVPCCRLSLRARERSRISQAYFSLHTEQLSLLLWNRTPIFLRSISRYQVRTHSNLRLDIFDRRRPLAVYEAVFRIDDFFCLPRLFERRLHLDADKLADWKGKQRQWEEAL